MNKKHIICISILLFSTAVFSQEISNTTPVSLSKPQSDNNEIRFNLAYSIAGFPELNYERFLYDNMGLGLSVAFSLESPDNEHGDESIRSIILPYYRVYFGQKKAAGFFIEGNMAIVRQKGIYNSSISPFSSMYQYDSYTSSYESTNFGFGAAIGVKLLTRNNFVGELVMGVGRLFGKPQIEAYPRLGVSIGKRF